MLCHQTSIYSCALCCQGRLKESNVAGPPQLRLEMVSKFACNIRFIQYSHTLTGFEENNRACVAPYSIYPTPPSSPEGSHSRAELVGWKAKLSVGVPELSKTGIAQHLCYGCVRAFAVQCHILTTCLHILIYVDPQASSATMLRSNPSFFFTPNSTF